jgi:ubiquitin C-terminal hydrolase
MYAVTKFNFFYELYIKYFVNPKKSITNYSHNNKGPRGLKNLGNTCFLNSVLQAVSSCPPFIDYLVDLEKSSPIKSTNSKLFTKSLLACINELRGKDSGEFSNKRYTYGNGPLDPKEILEQIVKFKSDFGGRDQQDAHELLQTLLALLVQEEDMEIQNNSKFFVTGFSDFESQSDGVAKQIYNNMPKRSSISTKVNPFEGWLASKLNCEECKVKKPDKHSLFSDIQLSIPRPLTEEEINANHSSPIINNNSTSGKLLLSSSLHIVNEDNDAKRRAILRSSTSQIIPRQSDRIHIKDCLDEFTKGECIDEVQCNSCTTNETIKNTEALVYAKEYGFGGDSTETSAQLSYNIKLCKSANMIGDSDSYYQDLEEGLIPVDENDFDHLLNEHESSDESETSWADTSISNESVSSKYSLYRYPIIFGCNSSSSYNMLTSLSSTLSRSSTNSLSSTINKSYFDENLIKSKKTTALKRISLSRLPPLLCLHIKRRSFNNLNGRPLKLNQHIVFPLNLDMTNYVKDYIDKDTKIENPLIKPLNYSLCSVIVHTGSADAGHYSTYCKVQNKWMFFSDVNVKEVKEREVLACQAYMLFYQEEKI